MAQSSRLAATWNGAVTTAVATTSPRVGVSAHDPGQATRASSINHYFHIQGVGRVSVGKKGEDWCILRTSGRTTLRLADTLAEDGFEVWTPAERKTVRIPRANIRRPVILPIMPSYVFARAVHLVDLLQMATQSFKPRRAAGKPSHVDFSVMHYHDTIPLIADAQLERLRRLEMQLAVKSKSAHRLPDGVDVTVKIEGGSFAGMKGVVRKSTEGYTLVCFSDRLEVKLPTLLLQQDVQEEPQPEHAPRHRNVAKYLGPMAHVGKVLSQKCEACNDEMGREEGATSTRP